MGIYETSSDYAYCDDTPTLRNHNRVFRRSDVLKAANEPNGRKLVTYKNGVYDISKFISSHPGGVEKIDMAIGHDLSPFWTQPEFRQHFRSPVALELLESMRVGNLHPDDVIEPDIAAAFENHDVVDSDGTDTPSISQGRVYKAIIIGAGLSGLQCAKVLRDTHKVPKEDILILEAQDYVGGRVRQMSEFIKGVPIDVGAEFIHGNGNTPLNRLARELNEPLRDLFIWAQGDGGPLSEPVGDGYALYCLKDAQGRPRLLRFDSQDASFVGANKVLWDIAHLDMNDYTDTDSLYDYLVSRNLTEEQIAIVQGGFANTLCTTAEALSLRRCIQWENAWHGEEGEGEDMDHGFENSFKVVVDHLKKDALIRLNSPVGQIRYAVNENDPFSHLVMVTTASGESYYAESLVITSSPHVLKSDLMTFNPPLDATVQEALRTTQMRNIVKVIMKFSEPVWPAGVRGMIMTDVSPANTDRWLLPEIWFRDVTDKAAPDEPAKAYAIGFTSAAYADKLMALPRSEVHDKCLAQMDEVFSLLQTEHITATDSPKAPGSISVSTDKSTLYTNKKPSEAFVGGMFWDWNPQHHPYIGGGYSSPLAGTDTTLGDLLRKPYGAGRNIFFAGEATNMPGATADAALESGVRAAEQVAHRLELS